DAILFEKVETSLPMAWSLTKLLAKLIKYAKQDSLHSRRLALQYLVNKKKIEDKEGKKLLDKLFSDLKERYKDRAGVSSVAEHPAVNRQGSKKQKFFNDKEPQKYHGFVVVDSEVKVIPDEENINFGMPPLGKEYKFIVNLGGAKTAKFNINNSNTMVLKTPEYFENTVKKVGFWDSENYFYELDKKQEKPTKSPNKSQSKAENKSD
ncbi:9458_t:CDS:2, partial [Ambispora leptoticha]